MGAIKFGYHTITWQDLETAMREISEVGFKGIESFGGVADTFAGKVDEFKSMLDKYGLQLVTLYGGGSLTDPQKAQDEIEWNVRVAKFIKECGGDILVMGGGEVGGDFKVMAQTLNEIGKRVRELGMKACYHPHLGTRVEKPEEIDTLMELTDPEYLYLCPDTAHITKGGGDAVEIIRKYVDRVAYVHFKDVRPDAEEKGLPIFSELGTGPVDFPKILQILQDAGYTGWIMIELDSTTLTPKESAQISKKYVEEVLGIKVSGCCK